MAEVSGVVLKTTKPAKDETSPEAIREMIEGLQKRGLLAGSDAAVEWLAREISRDVEDGLW